MKAPKPLKQLTAPPLIPTEKPKFSDEAIIVVLNSLGPGQSYDFLTDERRRVHELAEIRGLLHESFGASDARFIRVSRQADASQPVVLPPEAPKVTVAKQAPTKKAPKAKTSAKTKVEENDEDFDKILEAEMAQLAVCGVCGERPPWTAITCNYCKRKFCLKHTFPEIHGCGPEARRQARAPASLPPSRKAAVKQQVIKEKLDEAIAAKQKLRTTDNKPF
jgi:hypothetical protein